MEIISSLKVVLACHYIACGCTSECELNGNLKNMVNPKNTRSVNSKLSGSKARKPRFKATTMKELHKKLLEERYKYLHSAEEYQAEADSIIEGREPGDVQFDAEGGEGDTIAVERDRGIALSNQANSVVKEIDAALERMEDGTYGYCVTSGRPIPLGRLRVIPWAAESIEAKVGGFRRF